MKQIFLITLIAWFSVLPAAFGGIGDTYYCDMVEDAEYKKDAIQRYKPDRFTFRWNRGEIVFGKGTWFGDSTTSIVKDWSETNRFSGGDVYDRVTFVDDRFRYVHLMHLDKETTDELGVAEVKIIIANCSKFDD